jgi:hypothetical protein
MLGRHPGLYGFPELNLFVTDTVGELWDLSRHPVTGASSYTTGLLRTVAELEFGGQSEATMERAAEWVLARRSWHSEQMLRHLLNRIRPRTGVDKSPRTALSRRSIQRALSAFPNSRFIHLTRHPVTSLRSLLDSHVRSPSDNTTGASQAWLANFYAHLWIESQEVIFSELRHMGHRQATQVRGEDLLQEPEIHLAHLMDLAEHGLQFNSHPGHAPARAVTVRLPGSNKAGWRWRPIVSETTPVAAYQRPVRRFPPSGLANRTNPGRQSE